MGMPFITHLDADGVISLALLLRAKGEMPARFSSPTRILHDICQLVPKYHEEELFVTDISGSPLALRAASLFRKATWIDHHRWEVGEPPENVEVIVDPNAPSAASVVARYLGVQDPLVEIANQIDTNSIVDEEAARLRMYIAYLRRNRSGRSLGSALYGLAKELAEGGLEEVLEKNNEKIREFEEWMRNIMPKILKKTRIILVDGLKVAFYETTGRLPIFVVYESLKDHPEGPFDIIVVSFYRIRDGKISTKLEFRTMNQLNLLPLSRLFGGGGHERAAGATVDGLVDIEMLVRAIKGVYSK